MDNYWILGKSVEIKVSSKMAGYKMNLPFNAVKEIRVLTNSNLIAPKNYESVGFVLYDTKENNDEPAFSGDYLYYKIQLQ